MIKLNSGGIVGAILRLAILVPAHLNHYLQNMRDDSWFVIAGVVGGALMGNALDELLLTREQQ